MGADRGRFHKPQIEAVPVAIEEIGFLRPNRGREDKILESGQGRMHLMKYMTLLWELALGLSPAVLDLSLLVLLFSAKARSRVQAKLRRAPKTLA